MGHLKDLWHSLPEWAKSAIFTALLALLGAGFIEARRVILWLIKRKHEEVENALVAILCRDEGLFGKLVSELVVESRKSEKSVVSGLVRLQQQGRVYVQDSRTGQRWFFVLKKS